MPESHKSGEDRTLSPAFSQLIAHHAFRPQLLAAAVFAYLLVVAVICGCVASFGDKNDTVLAQSCASFPVRVLRRERTKKGGVPGVGTEVGAASYSRYSSDLQDETSIRDQQRACREKAVPNSHDILPGLEFFDEAVSGTKLHRDGLDAMLQAADEGRIKVLYLFSLSRLARESVITMPLLKKLVYVNGVRVIVVSEAIDTDQVDWEFNATFNSLFHERYVKNLAADVFRGQVGTVLDKHCVGDACYGYTSTPIQGSEVGRRGRAAKPRMQYEVDQSTSPWVIRIFAWFVVERRSIAWIVRELNRLGAPKGTRDRTGKWRRDSVMRILKNSKYIGRWPWGQTKTVRNPLTGKIRRVARELEDTEKWLRTFEHLCLIDNATFIAAQNLLQQSSIQFATVRKPDGRLGGSPTGVVQRETHHLLSRLVKCGKCGAFMQVGGSGGKYMVCPSHRNSLCDCRTQLRIDLAQELILNAIGERISADEQWRQAVFEETSRSWDSIARQVPEELVAAEKTRDELFRRKARLLDSIELGTASPDVAQRLAERTQELTALEHRIGRLRQQVNYYGDAPTEEIVDAQLAKLGTQLLKVDPSTADALRRLVGGEIVLNEIERPGKVRRYFRGYFALATDVLFSPPNEVSANTTGQLIATSSSTETITIDFLAEDLYEEQMNRVKELYDQGWLEKSIAAELGLARSRVTLLLQRWHRLHGAEMIDGRKRRSHLQSKQLAPPPYQAISDEVKRLCDEGVPMFEIGEQLNVSKTLVTKAHKYWYSSHGLTPPDGRVRRKELSRKVSHPRSKLVRTEAA